MTAEPYVYGWQIPMLLSCEMRFYCILLAICYDIALKVQPENDRHVKYVCITLHSFVIVIDTYLKNNEYKEQSVFAL